MPEKDVSARGEQTHHLLVKLKRFLAILGGFTPFAALYKEVWPNKLNAETGALGIAVGASTVLFVALELWHSQRNKSLLRFLGATPTSRPIIAMPSWVPNEGQTLGKRNYQTGKFETRSTRIQPGTSQNNLDTLMRAISAQPTISKMRPFYRLDESLWLKDHAEPRFLHEEPEYDGEEPISIISYGASSSNHLCRYVLSQPALHNDPHVYHFLPEINATGELDYFLGRLPAKRGANDGLPSRYEEKNKFEYALLIKFTIRRCFGREQRSKKATIFVCGGLDEFGSEATLKYLCRQWHHLWKVNGERDFYYLFKVSQVTKAIEGTAILHGTRDQGTSHFVFTRPKSN